MHLKTILNRVVNYKPFVVSKVHWDEKSAATICVHMTPRRNGKPECSRCGKRGPVHDRLKERSWDFVPLWQLSVVIVYAMRRVRCPTCGVVVERVPLSEGKHRQTKEMCWFLATWAKRLSWKEVATIFNTSWDTVAKAVRYAVAWGLVHREIDDVSAIGVDEIQWRRGHHYLTLVYEIGVEGRRLLWIARGRTEEALHRFFDLLGDDILPTLKFVCSDMWRAYLNVLRERAGHAVHILDRYHVMAMMNKAIDQVRAGEAKRMKEDGYEPILKHSRWCLLKGPENLTESQAIKLDELMKYNLQATRAYLLREDFQRFWNYHSPTWAGKFLDDWCTRTMRSKLDPMKKVAKTIRDHRALLLNWFHAEGTISAGIVEGFNNKAKLTMRKSYGFRTFNAIEAALYHALGCLPEPKSIHRFA